MMTAWMFIIGSDVTDISVRFEYYYRDKASRKIFINKVHVLTIKCGLLVSFLNFFSAWAKKKKWAFFHIYIRCLMAVSVDEKCIFETFHNDNNLAADGTMENSIEIYVLLFQANLVHLQKHCNRSTFWKREMFLSVLRYLKHDKPVFKASF